MTLILTKNEKKYWDFIRALRSNKSVENGFIDKVQISKKEQEIYMNKYNDNYYVCLNKQIPCGYIGEINGDIRLCTSPEFQGLGVGTFMIKELTKIKKNIFAKIKVENISSIKAFEKAGYEKKYFLFEPKKTS
jgi:RimJ/RimL family protein N-acetyltransferase|tara:strand:+ start:180 stop:578 length:399 start_codon:yes stop_codon:yes gene_type:complete